MKTGRTEILFSDRVGFTLSDRLGLRSLIVFKLFTNKYFRFDSSRRQSVKGNNLCMNAYASGEESLTSLESQWPTKCNPLSITQFGGMVHTYLFF